MAAENQAHRLFKLGSFETDSVPGNLLVMMLAKPENTLMNHS